MRNAGNAIQSTSNHKGVARTLLRGLISVMDSMRRALILSVVAMAVSGCTATVDPTDLSSVNTRADRKTAEPMEPYERSRALSWLGRYADAEIHARKAVELAKAEFGLNNPNTALRLRILARVYHAQQRFTEAESLFKQVLVIFEKTLRPDDPDIADVLNSLAEVYDAQDRVTDAESFYKRSMAVAENSGKLISPNLYNNLAAIYVKQGRYAEEESLLKHYISIPESVREAFFQTQSLELLRLFGPTSPYFAEAQPLVERYISTQKMAREDDSFARGLFALASLYKAQDKYAEAEPLYQRSLAIAEKAFGPEHLFVATVLDNYAALLRETDRDDGAAEMENRANAIRAKYE